MANSALESAESAPAETAHHSQHDAPPSYLQTQQLEEASAKQKPNTPQRPQHHTELQQDSLDCEGGVPTERTCNSPIVILVMGGAGCGKTSFIEKAIGYKNKNVAANIHAEHDRGKTFRIDSFSAELGGKQYLFLDTTGSSTIEDSDLDQTMSLCQQLSNTQDLNGILFIHPINADRMNICSMQYLQLFEAICGRSFMKNVMLLTNHWDMVKPEVGNSREGELRDDFWKGMIDAGAKIERLNPKLPGCVPTILEWFASRPPTVLAIKDEMAHQKKHFVETSIWTLMIGRILKSQAAMFPDMKYIRDLVTPEELRVELYKVTFKCKMLQKELEDCKEKLEEIQSKSVWHRIGFGW